MREFVAQLVKKEKNFVAMNVQNLGAEENFIRKSSQRSTDVCFHSLNFQQHARYIMRRHILKHSCDIFYSAFYISYREKKERICETDTEICGNVRKIERQRIYIENGVSSFKAKCDLIADNERRENKYSTGT